MMNTCFYVRDIKDTEETNKSVTNSEESHSRRKRYTRYYKIPTKTSKYAAFVV